MAVDYVEARINACRICLNTKYSNSVSFDDGECWLQMYQFCFGLTVTPEDSPRKLCGPCVKNMEDFSKFKNQTLKADKLWRNTTSTYSRNTETIFDDEEKSSVIKQEDCSFGNDASYDHTTSDFDDLIKEEEKYACTNTANEDLLEEKPCSLETDLQEQNHDEKMLKHSQTQRNKKVINVCKRCKKSFKFEKNYKRHLMKCKVKHKTNHDLLNKTEEVNYGKFDCGLCDEKSLNSADIKEHLNMHYSKNDLNCQLCEYNGRDFADMLTHRFVHQQTSKKKCNVCDKSCRTSLLLQYHFRSVHLQKPGGMCSVCNKEYKCYKSWRDHERWHKTTKYICDHCGRRFLYRNVIEAHLKDHGDYEGYVCHLCGKHCKRMSNLLAHVQQVHDNKRVKCTHCDKTFKNETNLKIHMQRESKEKKYQCEFCSKCYSAPGRLKKHMIWHTDERPFACHLCGSAYKANSQLKIHMRVHTGDLPFKCTVPLCPKAFASSPQLRVHLSVHSGKRRYKCPYCEKTFHNRSNVVMHCAKQHNVPNVTVVSSKDHFQKGES